MVVIYSHLLTDSWKRKIINLLNLLKWYLQWAKNARTGWCSTIVTHPSMGTKSPYGMMVDHPSRPYTGRKPARAPTLFSHRIAQLYDNISLLLHISPYNTILWLCFCQVIKYIPPLLWAWASISMGVVVYKCHLSQQKINWCFPACVVTSRAELDCSDWLEYEAQDLLYWL